MQKIVALIKELENRIPDLEKLDPATSSSPVGWHIEHSLLTIDKIVEAVSKSDPREYKWRFNFARLLVFTINKIPRGRAKAPDSVQPKTEFTTATLKIHVAATTEKTRALNSLEANSFFIHPFFDKLNLKPTIKFLRLHTQHHLAIINDIIKHKK